MLSFIVDHLHQDVVLHGCQLNNLKRQSIFIAQPMLSGWPTKSGADSRWLFFQFFSADHVCNCKSFIHFLIWMKEICACWLVWLALVNIYKALTDFIQDLSFSLLQFLTLLLVSQFFPFLWNYNNIRSQTYDLLGYNKNAANQHKSRWLFLHIRIKLKFSQLR